MKPVVIFVDDESKILKGLERILLNKEDEWEMKFFRSTSKAMDYLDSGIVDVVVSDINMPDVTGIEFIQMVKEKHPYVKRIIVSGSNDRMLTAKASKFAHQFFPKPYDTKVLVATITTLIKSGERLKNKGIQKFVNSIGEMPITPRTYMELEEELKSDEQSLSRITEIISKNPVIVAKILQLANSAFFGVKGKITSIVQAINFLGLNIIKSLVLCIEIFQQIKHFNQKYLDYLWNHSFSVAGLSKEIMQSFSTERSVWDLTYTAGLLHDIGKIILLNYDDYVEVMKQYEEQNYDIDTEEEKRIFEFTHADVGGYLLKIWGFPESIIRIVEGHHNFDSVQKDEFDPIIAVDLANQIVKYKNETEKIDLKSGLMEKFSIGEKLDQWVELAVQEGYE